MRYFSNYILFFLLSSFGLNSNLSSSVPDINHDDWKTIYDYNKVWVGTTKINNFDVCQTKTTLPYNYKEIEVLIKDLENYPNVFLRIKSAEVIKKNLVHLVVDMPYPFYDRDYIVEYEKINHEYHIIYQFFSKSKEYNRKNPNYVRLLNHFGEWRLIPQGKNQTQIIYTWNGELSGDFPEYAFERAWAKQGAEIWTWMRDAVENKRN